MIYDRVNYAAIYTADQLRSKIEATEDRMTRAETIEASLADAYVLQELQAALQLQSR